MGTENERYIKFLAGMGCEDHESLIKAYNDMAAEYDQFIVRMTKSQKRVAVDELETVVADKEALILDLAAGTGIIGEYLYDRGYKNLVALEPSEGMVEQAKKKNIYKEFILELVGKEQTSIKEGTYDAVICVGALASNHITPESFPEIIRITKNGGYIVVLARAPRNGRQEELMNRLVEEGRWTWVRRTVVPAYYFSDDGICYVMQKSM